MAVILNIEVTEVLPQLFDTVYDMVVLPPAIAYTIPLASIVATDVFELLQLPDGVVFDNVDVLPLHAESVPVIASTDGAVFTVIIAVATEEPHELLFV